MSKEKKPKKVTILEFRQVDTKNGKKDMVQFPKGIRVFLNDEELDLGQYGTLFVKRKEELVNDLEFFKEKGYMNEEQFDKQIERIETKQVRAVVVTTLK